MYRDIIEKLANWREKADRKILLLAGGKGVGKTWTIKDFGEGFFDNVAYFDLKKWEYAQIIFKEELETERIKSRMEMSSGNNIIAGNTLIVLENIDSIDNSIDVLKFFSENMSDYHIIITTYNLENGITEKYSDIDILNLYHLSFSEFLICNKQASLCDKVKEAAKEPLSILDKELLFEYMRRYIVIGGMPYVVKAYIESKEETAMQNALEARDELVKSYIEEIESIHSKSLKDKVMQVWNSIGKQLANDNKKFMYSEVKITARAREYSEALEWLINKKLVLCHYRVTKIEAGLEKNCDKKSFQVFMNDIGILSYVYGLDYNEVSKMKNPFDIQNGAIIEQYVFNELCCNYNIENVYYWISEATAKIEFVFEDSGVIIPININLTENTKSQSLKVYNSRYIPPMSIVITLNTIDMNAASMLKLPVYSIWNL